MHDVLQIKVVLEYSTCVEISTRRARTRALDIAMHILTDQLRRYC